ncbi:NAD-dependent succinate-semialdehyde dehydrogenase [Pseudomaricurvus alcaniphilus]|uniref:NAD-dependent succinate-semialdehyde dehydrogenase n=1 Tax=Pseudomaricurvus alcaniphilus TaxID=1166482 RepID=UPI0014078776|nr:NAD-dependent succinate-semialdehyde dehydrogenase [Pseudomaricurvus alcaniphilus]NHN38024.1 NAD-dependent succinate-semialdehyde dehydrogenase [Pseudomaricurvus alcaniphilus]
MESISDSQLFQNGSFVDGQWLKSDHTFAVSNPATGAELCTLSDASVTDTERAVSAAAAALPGWRGKTAKERANILRRWFDLIMQHQDELAAILTAEQGKPLAEAKGEIAYGANYVEWFAEEAKRVYGDTIPHANSNSRIVVIKQPVGVVSAITPWNFPNAMIARKAAPALAAGCTFIVKAAHETPLSALALAGLAKLAGVPDGVFNVLVSTRSQEVGAVLTSDPRIAKFSFTGSTAVGKILLAQCASTVKKTSMELGGNAPFIVFNDADLDAAVKGAMASKYRNAGQTCVCTNRLLVQSDIYPAFAAKLVAAVGQLKVGSGSEAGTDIGPLINEKAAANVRDLIASAVADGASVLTDADNNPGGSCFVAPTVLGDVSPRMRVATDEIFGPVAPLIKFDTEAEAIALANDTNVGLASYIYTRDIGRVWRVSEALEYGIVGINEGLISNEMAPFGGFKESGMGREGSKYGIEDYLEIKYLCMGGIDS